MGDEGKLFFIWGKNSIFLHGVDLSEYLSCYGLTILGGRRWWSVSWASGKGWAIRYVVLCDGSRFLFGGPGFCRAEMV